MPSVRRLFFKYIFICVCVFMVVVADICSVPTHKGRSPMTGGNSSQNKT
jgi:hypothetical protein